MDNPAKVKKFWTVIIHSIEIAPNQMMQIQAKVRGWFIYVIMTAGKYARNLDYHYLTPRDRPFEFDIPPWFFEDKTIDRVTSKDVVNQFIRLMKTQVDVVPPKPLDIPWHKIPVSKRKEIIAKLLQQQESELRAKEPGSNEEIR